MSSVLFNLLPAVYRTRDKQIALAQPLLTTAELAQISQLQATPQPLSAEEQAELTELQARASRGPLESLLMLVDEQLAAVAYDINQLYDDQFIETCAPWVIPYIGDLIGYQSIKGIAPSVDNPRAAVAETISLRRRKGTVLVMEQLARDVTGWGAHAVEEFQVLAATQSMVHLRRHNLFAPDLRQWQPGLYMNTAFDATAHKVDVRSIASGRGRHNIANIGIFLWSLTAQTMTKCPLTPDPSTAQCYRFHPLGMDIPLFHAATSQGETISVAAGPPNVPDALRRRVLCADIAQGVGASYYGEGASLALYLDDELLNRYQLAIADLSDDTSGKVGEWINVPASNSPYLAAIDPESGRVALSPAGSGHTLTASWRYGANSNLGGGEYARNTSASPFSVTDPAFVVPYSGSDSGTNTLQQAINDAIALLPVNGAVAVEISGGVVSGEFPTVSAAHIVAGALTIDLPAGSTFELRAANLTVQTLLLNGSLSISGDADSNVVLNGLVLAAGASMTPSTNTPALVTVPFVRPVTGAVNALAAFTLTDCTLVPGWSLAFDGTPAQPAAPALQVTSATVTFSATSSILGAVQANSLATVSLTDSILDATDRGIMAYSAPNPSNGGGALTLNACTVVGRIHASVLTLVTDSILWSAVSSSQVVGLVADRKQQGCVRFSFLPFGSITPPPFNCVTEAVTAPQPYFVATRYGRPGYLKLLACTDDSIRRGADDGGEMGVYHSLLAPQRESDLRIRLQEYMPVGLTYGLIYQN